MRNSFRFLIEHKFRVKLFEKALAKEGTIKNLAMKLKCNRNLIRVMRTDPAKFIEWRIVKKLIEIIGISEEQLEPHILAVKGGMSGKITKVRFPIKESPELALLVAKGMGDGSIEKDKFRFSFWNKEWELIKEVCKCVNKAVGKTKGTIIKLKDGRIQVKFCPFIGLVLHLSGVPVGDKTIQDFDVPTWIKNGSKEVKASFLRGIFDDEGCVINDKKRRTRGIFISLCKDTEKRNSLEVFLSSIRRMLLELEINSSDIREQMRFKNKENKEKIMLRFDIRGKENLENFLNKVSFTHPKKNSKLKEAVKSFVDIHKTKKKILEIILKSSRPLSTVEVSKLTSLDRELVLLHLNDLATNGKIFKSKATVPHLWFKKDLSFIISRKEKVLEALRNFAPLTVKEIAKITRINEKRVFEVIKKLSKKELVLKAGKTRSKNTFANLWALKKIQ
jgi:predicted transcriptional regulator